MSHEPQIIMSRENKEIKKITNTQSTALKNKKHPNKGTKKQIPALKKLTSQQIEKPHTPRSPTAAK